MTSSFSAFKHNRISNLIIIAFIFFIITYRLLIVFNSTPELSTGETNNIWNVLNVIDGKAIYSDPETIPFEIFQYTPLSQLPIIAIGSIFDNSSINYPYSILFLGRLLSLIYNLITFYFVFKIMKERFKVSNTLSLLTSIIGFSLLTHLSFAVRPDSMALLFIISSTYFYLGALLENKNRYEILTGVILGVSFFVKQDAFLIIAAFGICFLIFKEWKKIINLSFSFILSITVLFFYFSFYYGDVFVKSVFGGISLGYDFEQFVQVFLRFIALYTIIPIIGFFLIFFKLLKFKKLNKIQVFLILVNSFLFAISVFSSFKKGSWINYYTPFVIFIVFFLIYELHYLKDKKKYFLLIGGIIASFYFLFLQVFHYTSPFLNYKNSKSKHEAIVTQFTTYKYQFSGKKIFTFDKDLKLLFYENTIFPNTEYYHVTRFSKDVYADLKENKKISYYIYDEKIGNNQLSTFNYFKVNVEDYKLKEKILNYLIYERK